MRRSVGILVLAAFLILSGPFGKGMNYMSPAGYQRWQKFLKTGTWIAYGGERKTGGDGRENCPHERGGGGITGDPKGPQEQIACAEVLRGLPGQYPAWMLQHCLVLARGVRP